MSFQHTLPLLLKLTRCQVFCPLSMTDGVARILELVGNEEAKKDIIPRLIR
jgi:hypothetical protein